MPLQFLFTLINFYCGIHSTPRNMPLISLTCMGGFLIFTQGHMIQHLHKDSKACCHMESVRTRQTMNKPVFHS